MTMGLRSFSVGNLRWEENSFCKRNFYTRRANKQLNRMYREKLKPSLGRKSTGVSLNKCVNSLEILWCECIAQPREGHKSSSDKSRTQMLAQSSITHQLQLFLLHRRNGVWLRTEATLNAPLWALLGAPEKDFPHHCFWKAMLPHRAPCEPYWGASVRLLICQGGIVHLHCS